MINCSMYGMINVSFMVCDVYLVWKHAICLYHFNNVY